jgi:hypothetical protein
MRFKQGLTSTFNDNKYSTTERNTVPSQRRNVYSSQKLFLISCIYICPTTISQPLLTRCDLICTTMCCLVILFHLDLTRCNESEQRYLNRNSSYQNMNDNIVLTEVAYTDNGLSIVLKNILWKKNWGTNYYTKGKQSKGKRKWKLPASEHCSKLQSQPGCVPQNGTTKRI